jgi:hypothetical protein
MLRLRTPSGQLKEIPPGCALELVGTDGKLAVLWLQKTPTTTTQLGPGDLEFDEYCRVTRQRSQAVIVLPDPTQQPKSRPSK